MSRNNTQVNVRMPHETVDELKVRAAENRRSMTAQLNVIVEEWLKQKQQDGVKA